MNNKRNGLFIIVIGVVVLFISIAADALGLGGGPGFGWKQILGTSLGIILALGGVWLSIRKANNSR